MVVNKYKLSFTAASLSINESVKIAEVYLDCRNWTQTKLAVTESNLLQSRTNSRTIRVVRELIQRLERLTDSQLELLVEGNPTEQKYILWLAACKTYEIIQEFAVEVLYEKFMSRSMTLTDLDYDAFFNRKADWNEKLGQIAASTQGKIRQVLLLMVKEAGLVSDGNMILRAMLSKRLVEAIVSAERLDLLVFPVEPV